MHVRSTVRIAANAMDSGQENRRQENKFFSWAFNHSYYWVDMVDGCIIHNNNGMKIHFAIIHFLSDIFFLSQNSGNFEAIGMILTCPYYFDLLVG